MKKDFLASYRDYVEKIQYKKIVIFCAGNKCMEILRDYFHFPYDDIAFICDNDPRKARVGVRVFNIEVCSPDRLKQAPDDYAVIIATADDFSLKRIEAQLEGMGVKDYYPSNVLTISNRKWRFNSEGKPRFHERNTFGVITLHMAEINKVREMLADDKSKNIYDEYIKKLKYNIKDYSDIAGDLYEHYFSDGIFKYKQEEVLVDGGAYNGDDTIWFSDLLVQESKNLKSSVCFEPDTKNFGETYRNLENFYKIKADLDKERSVATAEKFTVFKAGLYDDLIRVGFYEKGKMGSKIVKEDTGSSVDTLKLDDVVVDKEVSFIKFDLEGADIPALRGAEKTIKRHRPKLALSIYHNIEDLWEIPLMVKSMVPEYKLFVRHHAKSLCDKILYAAVEEDLI